MNFTTGGIDAFKLRLERLAMTPVIASEELKRCADDVLQKSKDMAPYDYGDLVRAIQVKPEGSKERNAKGQFLKYLSTFVIWVNPRTNVADPKKIAAGIVKVEEYFWNVHEHMGWAGNPGATMLNGTSFMPSKESVERGLALGVDSGGKFLERAVEDQREGVLARMAQIVKVYMRSI